LGFAENIVGFRVSEFLESDISEPDLGSVGLQLDRSPFDQRLARCKVIVQSRVDHDRFVVEPYPATFPYETYFHGIPLSDGVISSDKRIFPSPASWVVPKTTTPFLIAVFAVVLGVRIPNLDLRNSSQVNS